jgi:phosphatidylinositol phospholipase C, epsilon
VKNYYYYYINISLLSHNYLFLHRSNKLKAFWFSISDEPLPALDFLSAALLSAEYERALGRALAMPECRLIPFFGAFLRELR